MLGSHLHQTIATLVQYSKNQVGQEWNSEVLMIKILNQFEAIQNKMQE